MKLGSSGVHLAWIFCAYSRKMYATSRGFFDRIMSWTECVSARFRRGVRRGHRTCAASALRILMLRLNMSGFLKHRLSVAMAIVWGIAQKLKTLWFLSRRR